MNAQANPYVAGVSGAFLPAHPKAKESYEMLRKVNVNDKIEKKNGLSYLSWAFAVDTLLQHDPDAHWEYPDPKSYGDTLMVFCSVTAFGRTRTSQLPVMNHRNQAIPNPNAFEVNTAMQRCLVKAIALHGLGLYIYAGEDLPAEDHPDGKVDPRGDLGKGDPALYADWAAKMRKILRDHAEPESTDGERKALMACLDLHDTLRIQGDLYVGASNLLTASQRSGWKKLVEMAKKLELSEARI